MIFQKYGKLRIFTDISKVRKSCGACMLLPPQIGKCLRANCEKTWARTKINWLNIICWKFSVLFKYHVKNESFNAVFFPKFYENQQIYHFFTCKFTSKFGYVNQISKIEKSDVWNIVRLHNPINWMSLSTFEEKLQAF